MQKKEKGKRGGIELEGKYIPWGMEMMGWEEQSQTQGVQEEEEWLMSSMRCQ